MKNNYEALEFEQIQQTIASYCMSALAKNKVYSLIMFGDLDDLNDEFNRVEEALTFIRLQGRLPLHQLPDISQSLAQVRIDGTLSFEQLLDIKNVLINVKDVKNYFEASEKSLDYLLDYVEGLENDQYLIDEIERCISTNLTMYDHASDTLFRLRKQKITIENAIRKQMEHYVKDSKDTLSLDSFTTKNDRLVLPVKAHYKNQYKGIIHSESATGQTFFIEPEDIVMMNNELNEVKIAEAEEIKRILFMLSQRVKQRVTAMTYNQELLMVLDFIFAKAYYGYLKNGCIPTITMTKNLTLKEARHPLIDQDKVIANDVLLDQNMLLITGSNTGGKTVTLKTVGLLSLMALCGIPVLCHEAIIPFFDDIFVDVGDEQSIEQSLSTFSSHLKRLVSITEEATGRSLVIIDEIGSGTDPVEGTFLAQAILDYLLQKDCMIFVSSHYGGLKTFGQMHDSILVASVGFDLETMKPTYRLKLDSVGSSYAFEIAASLGLNTDIIEKGQKLRDDNISEETKLLEKLEKQKEDLDFKESELHDLIESEKKKLKQYEHLIKQFEKEKESVMKKAQDDANTLLEETKEYINTIVDDLKNQGQLKQHLIIDAKHQLDGLKQVEKVEIQKQQHQLNVGDHIRVNKMNREGDIIEILKNHYINVSLGGLSVKLHEDEVTFLHPKTVMKKVKTNTKPSIKKTGTYEINIIGKRYEEAMELVDKFLDDALVLGYPHVRIVHGMGTGVLRKGIRKMLDKNKHVVSYRDGGPNEGGLGATLVYFE